MVGIPIAIAYTNAFEWFVHKHLLHGMGKRKTSIWSFHWHDHHRAARRANMFDDQYVRSVFTWSPQGKEALSVVLAALLHAPLFFVAPYFTAYVFLHAIRYYWLHKRAHMDHEWCKVHSPVHYDHHMGKDQNANWCVTHPWFDYVMGTRKKYVYDETGRVLSEEPVPTLEGFVNRVLKPLAQGHKDRVRVVREKQPDIAEAA